jgi:NAD(P)H-dependent FMN reductase
MKLLVVSSSHDPKSRSEELARRCAEHLKQVSDVHFISLKEYSFHGRDLHDPIQSPAYRQLHQMVSEADGLVLASPVYNWSCCAELKRFVEVVGTTPPDGSLKGAFYDKVVAFVNAAGLPHSYMAFSSLASSMMLDFKCIISPYNVYVNDRDWESSGLSKAATERISKSMDVFAELTSLLKHRTYKSVWEI